MVWERRDDGKIRLEEMGIQATGKRVSVGIRSYFLRTYRLPATGLLTSKPEHLYPDREVHPLHT